MASHKKTLKIVILGDSGVGKTSLMNRYSTGKFTGQYKATIGADFLSKDNVVVTDHFGQRYLVTLQIWDTAGQERFARVLLPTYFRKAKGVILVFDITNAKSFESLSERWMAQLNDHASADDLAKLLVGNKSDLETSREVTRDKVDQFCQEYGMEFLETSAKSGENVLQAFEKLIAIVHDRALAASKNKQGIKGMNGAAAPAGGNPASSTVKLEEGATTGGDGTAAADACGC
mmetsp:Transcript_13265/g.24903  ORF Transcript_13265/g.24903 Transcript_13265/m.24903 type:complete len:232 (+) Transcript_13265:234-929(+)